MWVMMKKKKSHFMEDWKLPVELENVFGLLLLFRIAVDLRYDFSFILIISIWQCYFYSYSFFRSEIECRATHDLTKKKKKLNLKNNLSGKTIQSQTNKIFLISSQFFTLFSSSLLTNFSWILISTHQHDQLSWISIWITIRDCNLENVCSLWHSLQFTRRDFCP